MEHDMGIGKIGTPNMIFVRKFRFVLKGNHLESDWIMKVKVNWVKKTIIITGYESFINGNVPICHWGENIQNDTFAGEELTLTTLDGTGEELYSHKFSHLNVLSRTSHFDYRDNDVANHKIKLHYDHVEEVKTDLQVENMYKKETIVHHLNTKATIVT